MHTAVRLKPRKDRFVLRGWTYEFNLALDGATLSRLDHHASVNQHWNLDCGKCVEMRPGDVQDVSKQVLDVELPPCKGLNAKAEPNVEATDLPSPDSSGEPDPPAGPAVDPVDYNAIIADLRAQLAAKAPVETPEQITAEVKKLAESAASGPPQFSPPVATPTWGDGGKSIPDDLDTPLAAMVEPESNDIPDELLAVMQANPDEGPTEYRGRLQNLLHRFGIEDGKHFPGGGEALSADEKILIGRLLQVGAKSKQWAGL